MADVNCIRFNFETEAVSRMVWIPSNEDLADPGCKPDSQNTPARQLLIHSGHVTIILPWNSLLRPINRLAKKELILKRAPALSFQVHVQHVVRHCWNLMTSDVHWRRPSSVLYGTYFTIPAIGI